MKTSNTRFTAWDKYTKQHSKEYKGICPFTDLH